MILLQLRLAELAIQAMIREQAEGRKTIRFVIPNLASGYVIGKQKWEFWRISFKNVVCFKNGKLLVPRKSVKSRCGCMWRRTHSASWSRPRMSSRTTPRKSLWFFALILIYVFQFLLKSTELPVFYAHFFSFLLPSFLTLSSKSGWGCRKQKVRIQMKTNKRHFIWKLLNAWKISRKGK